MHHCFESRVYKAKLSLEILNCTDVKKLYHKIYDTSSNSDSDLLL